MMLGSINKVCVMFPCQTEVKASVFFSILGTSLFQPKFFLKHLKLANCVFCIFLVKNI